MKNQDLCLASNPFSTRFTRPGAIPFCFPDSISIAQLADRLEANQGCGQIVGPHGSGKSTLLAALLPAMSARGWQVERHFLDLRCGDAAWWQDSPDTHGGRRLVVVDGFEQLTWWARFRLHRACRRRSMGLLATTHCTVRLPVLWETQPTLELARRLVGRLLTTDQNDRITEEDVTLAFRKHQPNLREMLFHLYDVYQQSTSVDRLMTEC